jgi:predicted nucleotidyltransferase component of viral defense system
MKKQSYKDQVSLLLTVLPEVGKEENLAMHGGTAINFFVREMPRISVDIDLTYLPIEDRATSLQNIDSALERIKTRIEKLDPEIKVQHKKEDSKLLIFRRGAIVKLEVNQIMRGVISSVTQMTLCQSAQIAFDAYCEIAVVPKGQLLGGKICAALDRQHPRDLFDVKYILKNEGFNQDIKTGLIYCLSSSVRPSNELLNPNYQDQQEAMENQFDGMTEENFSYEEYEATRLQLTKTVIENLSKADKAFILSINKLEPDWDIYNFEQYPSVRWKLRNLQKLRDTQPEKFKDQYDLLEQLLNGST